MPADSSVGNGSQRLIHSQTAVESRRNSGPVDDDSVEAIVLNQTARHGSEWPPGLPRHPGEKARTLDCDELDE